MDFNVALTLTLCFTSTVYQSQWTREGTAYDNLYRADDSDFAVSSLLDCGRSCSQDDQCSGFSHSKSLGFCQLHSDSTTAEITAALDTMRFYAKNYGNTAGTTTPPTTAHIETTSSTANAETTVSPTTIAETTTLPTTANAEATTSPTTATTETTTSISTANVETTALTTTANAETTTSTTANEETTLSMTSQVSTTDAPTTNVETTTSSSTTVALPPGSCPSIDTYTTLEMPGGGIHAVLISGSNGQPSSRTSYCQAFNSESAIIDTPEKHAFLGSILRNCSGFQGRDYYVDGYRNSGAWEYSDGRSMNLDDALIWQPGSPRMGPGSGSCVFMKESFDYRLDNDACNYASGIVCMNEITTK